MRTLGLIFVLVIFAACEDSPSTMGARDMAAGGGNDLAMTMMMNQLDLAVPDLAIPPGIAGVRAAADRMLPDGGTTSMVSIPVENVVVTYVKALSLAPIDVPGFFVQEAATGPALFVAIDPATLPSPGITAGDRVSFTVTAVWISGGVRMATGIENLQQLSTGFDIETLRQDLSGANDLVTGIDNYESELATVTGTVVGPFAQSGVGYVGANLTTAGVTAMTNNLKVRMPSTVRDALDITSGCVVTVKAPMWRFFAAAQPTAWVEADVTVSSCAAPQVVSARATSPTTVVVTFDRQIDDTTVTAGSFTFTSSANSITASSFMVSGNTVTVTTTAQTSGQVYTVEVGNTVKDKRGTTLNPSNDTAMFNGYAPPAVLIISELNPSITGDRDVVELKALTGGNLDGFELFQGTDPSARLLLTTLPDLVVATGDFVLVHLTPATGITAETNTNGKAACTDSTCIATAWDVRATTGQQIAYSARSVSLVHPDGTTIKDVMILYRSGGGITYPAGFHTDVKYIVDHGLWGDACPNSCATNNDAITIAVDGQMNSGIQSNFSGRSIKRLNDIVPSRESYWTVGANTWGM